MLDQGNQSLGDRILLQVALAEDSQNVLDPGSGRLSEQVFSTDAIEVLPGRRPRIPVGEQCLGISQQRPRLDDLGRVAVGNGLRSRPGWSRRVIGRDHLARASDRTSDIRSNRLAPVRLAPRSWGQARSQHTLHPSRGKTRRRQDREKMPLHPGRVYSASHRYSSIYGVLNRSDTTSAIGWLLVIRDRKGWGLLNQGCRELPRADRCGRSNGWSRRDRGRFVHYRRGRLRARRHANRRRRLDRLDESAFFRRLIRRIGTLVESYGNPTDDARGFDDHALSVLADQVAVIEQSISIQSWERYSSRQEARHPLSGLVGQALLTDIPEPLWPYLILGQWVHVGKGASFGQGRYVVLPQDEAGTGSIARPRRPRLTRRMVFICTDTRPPGTLVVSSALPPNATEREVPRAAPPTHRIYYTYLQIPPVLPPVIRSGGGHPESHEAAARPFLSARY